MGGEGEGERGGEREKGREVKGGRVGETRRHVPVCVGPTLHNVGDTAFICYIISVSDVKEIEFGVQRSTGALELRGALRALCELCLLWREGWRVGERGRERGREVREREGGRGRERGREGGGGGEKEGGSNAYILKN